MTFLMMTLNLGLLMGCEYLINDNINIGIAAERDNYISFRFAIKRSLKAKQFNYSKPKKTQNESAETTLIRKSSSKWIGC